MIVSKILNAFLFFVFLVSCGTNPYRESNDNVEELVPPVTVKAGSEAQGFEDEPSPEVKNIELPPKTNLIKGTMNFSQENYETLVQQINDSENLDTYSEAFLLDLKAFFKVKAINDYQYFKLDKHNFFVLFWEEQNCARYCYNNYKVYLMNEKKGIVNKADFSVNEGGYEISIVGDNLLFIKDESIIAYADHDETKVIHNYFYIMDDKIIELKKADKKNLRLARNHLFAKKGYQFKSEDLKHYFGQKDWYEPHTDHTDNLLNDSEKRVVEDIAEMENNAT